jgi:putative ABC transport system permease protein
VISYSVNQRTHEIGIRLALGAGRGDVAQLILRRSLGLTLLGAGLGLAGAFAVTRALSSVLYGVSATDPLTFAGVPLLLLLVATCACIIPVRRAVRVDPTVALKYE